MRCPLEKLLCNPLGSCVCNNKRKSGGYFLHRAAQEGALHDCILTRARTLACSGSSVWTGGLLITVLRQEQQQGVLLLTAKKTKINKIKNKK